MDQGFLNLFGPKELFDKLAHDYQLFLDDPVDSYRAYNFFVTAEHLPDWIGDVDIKHGNIFLRICSHLATGAKHFKVTNKKKNSVETTTVDIYAEDGYFEDGYCEVKLAVTLTEAEAKELGAEAINLVDLATEVYRFWEAKIQEIT